MKKQLCHDISHDLKRAYHVIYTAHGISTCAKVNEHLVEAMAKIDSVADRVGIDLTSKDEMQ